MSKELRKKKRKQVQEYAHKVQRKMVESKKRAFKKLKQMKSMLSQPAPHIVEKRKYHSKTPIEDLSAAHDTHFKRRVLERMHEDRFFDDPGIELLKLIIEYSIASGEAKFLEESYGVLRYLVTICGKVYIVVYSLKTERYVTIYPPYKYEIQTA
jgi:hypothetical protein